MTPHPPDEDYARRLDAADPLAPFRDQFLIPPGPDGKPCVYLCGHSLGLQPRAARDFVMQEMEDWAALGVEGHFRGRSPWYSYHETVRDAGARLVGAEPGEVVFMNSLTVNLHLMLATFYRPTPARFRILTDEPAFPSDLYALQTHIRHRGYDTADALLAVSHPEQIDDALTRHGDTIAVVLLNAVNFLTGQYFDIPHVVAAAHRHGCVAGLDLAHAAGNVPLRLHDWGADFAVWCSYKYLNGSPGAVAGCFVHERHGANPDLSRLAGWWGNDPATRFRMHLEPRFVPKAGADGWQVSNPPILALAPVRASLALFDAATMPALRAKSERLTGYLESLLDRLPPGRFEVVTPRDPARRGCMLSLVVHDRPRERVEELEARGVVCDFREPNVVRVAPVPLYNTFHDVWAFASSLA
ncbi:MAG TPA: kynureninase [Gemmataceae bacterium]|jgi:kynureninase